VFLQPYAETKALGEDLVRKSCGSKKGDLLTIAVAPHQVYGPRDRLFLPALLRAARGGSGSRRIACGLAMAGRSESNIFEAC
jgi:nucleoside-diphosphate-sugar epimerase